MSEQMEFDLGHRVEVVFPLVEVQPPTWSLPPFSGKRTRCAKCGLGAGGDDLAVGVYFHTNVMYPSPCFTLWNHTPPSVRDARGPFPEHLDRTCVVCQHQWVERIADNEDSED